MPHQQKLVHIQDITGIGAANGVAIACGLQYDANNEPALAIPRHECTVEVHGGDPSGTWRWWLTAITPAGFTLNWAGATPGVNLHVVARIFHSICFDISSAEQPY